MERKKTLSLFTDDTIIYIQNPKESIKIILKVISNYSKVEKYKINVQKSIAFPYMIQEERERQLGINIAKYT